MCRGFAETPIFLVFFAGLGRGGIEPPTNGLKEAESARSRYPVARNRMIT